MTINILDVVILIVFWDKDMDLLFHCSQSFPSIRNYYRAVIALKSNHLRCTHIMIWTVKRKRRCSMWFSRIFAIFIISNSFIEITAKDLQEKKYHNKDEMIYEKYIEMDKSLQSIIRNGVKNALPYVIEANEHLNLSSRCVSNLFTLTSEIRKLKLSAVKCKLWFYGSFYTISSKNSLFNE